MDSSTMSVHGGGRAAEAAASGWVLEVAEPSTGEKTFLAEAKTRRRGHALPFGGSTHPERQATCWSSVTAGLDFRSLECSNPSGGRTSSVTLDKSLTCSAKAVVPGTVCLR